MILRIGSTGQEVKNLQELLGLTPDGSFGPKTEQAVKIWQYKNHLHVDGIVGPKSWDMLELATTDMSESMYSTEEGLQIERYYLPKGEYKKGPTKKSYLFLHHTAGWHNPFKTIDQWGRDSRGTVATEFVLGGPSVKGNDDKYDGKMVQCMPEGSYGWHLGKNGSQFMHVHSVGLEICNFGYVNDNGKTYAGTTVHESQKVDLDVEFRNHLTWHKYSEAQLESTRKLILHVADRDDIDVRSGLIEEIKKHGAKGFEFNPKAYNGETRGMWTHTNTRKDKSDLSPQQDLIDMLLSI